MPFTVTIIGGGIGGLALAVGLLNRGIPIQLYEAASAFTEIGLGLSLGPAAYRALPLLDPALREIYDSLVTTHADSPGYEEFRTTWFEFVWACGSDEGKVLMDLKAEPSGQTALKRADFVNALVRLVPRDCIHFGKRLVGIEEGVDVKLEFEDGDVVNADVVIGCDGIRSRVKEFVCQSCELLPRYSGMYGYRAVLDMDDAVDAVGDKRARVASMYVGKGAYGISYPIMQAKKVNVGVYVLSDEWDHDSWVRPAKRGDLQRDTEGMGRYVKALAERMPDPSQWAIFEHPHISTYARSRVVIMGDAAHASTPHQGAGAGQAIEDAHVLAELLNDAGVKNVDDAVLAFQAYDSIRRPRSQRVVTSSKENADLLCLCLEGVSDDSDRLKETLNARFGWLWNLDVQGQAQQAREKMAQLMANRSSSCTDCCQHAGSN
ncbi:unnamed protein product [Penicillium salamii]|nr:unnamed protein product [Penicillium salamii]